MPTSTLRSAARRAADAIGDRAAVLVVVGGVAVAALAAADLGAPPVVVLGVAALPLILGIGQQHAFALLTGLLLTRALTDNSGNQLLNIAIAMGITGLAMLVLIGTRGVAMPVAALVVGAFASAAAGAPANGASITFGEAFRVTSAIAVAVVAAHAPGRVTIKRISTTVQLVTVVPALFALYQLATGTGQDISGSIRSNGTLSHPNSAAMLFAVANLVTFARVLMDRNGRALQLGLLVLFLVAQASTGSVGGLAAMLAMFVVYLLTGPVRRADRVLVTIGALAIGAVAVLSSSIGASRLSEFTAPADPNHPNSLLWRLGAWGDVLTAWQRHPFFGNGLGSTLAKTIVPGNIPHNEYVRLLAEVGVVGFVVVIGLGIGFAVRFSRLGRVSSVPQAASLALAALAGTAVNGLAANTMLYSASFYMTLFILGGAWRILRETGTAPADASTELDPPAARTRPSRPFAAAVAGPARQPRPITDEG